MGHTKILTPPVQSPSDKKSYRSLRLSNGLTVLLVNNATTSDSKQLSAAALVVNAGSFHEPPECHGLAHFCEHMLFMGSKKYPDENHFSSFVSCHGGATNACTDDEYTKYIFSIKADKLHEGLDIWAQFFIDPIMGENAVDRELCAVNSEFEMSSKHDGTRLNHVRKETVMVPHHPMSRFNWGNTKSLKTDLANADPPMSAYQMLHKWYPENYSAKWMYLTVQSTNSLDDMQKWVEEIFSAIPNRGIEEPKNEPDYSVGAFGNIHRITRYLPVGEMSWFVMAFVLPSQVKFYKTTPVSILILLMRQKGPGSILSYLKRMNWALEIDVYTNENNYNTILEIEIRVTESGLKHWTDIADIILAFVQLIRNKNKEEMTNIFEQLKQIQEIEWNTKEETLAYDNCYALSSAISKYPPADWLQAGSVLSDCDLDVIERALAAVTAENCFLEFGSPSFAHGEELNKIEKWTGSKYSVKNMSDKLLARWKKVESVFSVVSSDRLVSDSTDESLSATLHSNIANILDRTDLFLPKPNRFLPKSFKIKTDEPGREWKYVRKLVSNPSGELWFKGDNVFNLPRGVMSFSLRSQHNFSDHKATTIAMTALLSSVLNNQLTEEMETARLAEIQCVIKTVEDGIQIILSGITDQIGLMLTEVMSKLEEFNLTETEFDTYKALLVDDWKSALQKSASYGSDLRVSILCKGKRPLIARRAALIDLRYEAFVHFVHSFRQHCWVQALFEGNFYQQEAVDMFQSTVQQLGVIESDYFYDAQALHLPNTPHIMKTKNLNQTDVNSFFNWYWQIGRLSLADKARYDLLLRCMNDECFDFLRNQKQLGYTVYAQLHKTDDVFGVSITVYSQRDKFTVEKIKETVDEFLQLFTQTLKNTTDTAFEECRLGLIHLKAAKDTNLLKGFTRDLGELESFNYMFDRRELEIEQLKKVEKEMVTDAFVEGIVNNKSILVTTVEGNLPSDLTKMPALTEENVSPGDIFKDYSIIKDICAFRNSNQFYSNT